MKTQLIPSHRRQGFTYMTVVITMIVVGLMLAAYLKLVSVQSQLTARSQTWNRSVPVLEAGVEEAIAHLNKNGSPVDGVVNLALLAGDGWDNHGSANGPWSKEGTIDDDYYQVTISSWDGSTTQMPTICSTGFVAQMPAWAWNHAPGPFLAAANQAFSYSRRVVECLVTNNPTFSKALVAKRGVDLNGRNLFTDSYDSRYPTMSTGGQWDITKRRDHGDVASNDTVTNSVNVANASIWGRVSTGPSGTVAIGPVGSVGDAAWHLAGAKGIKSGFSTDDMNVEFPDVVMPDVAWGSMPAGGTVNGITYNYIFSTSGDYRMPSGTLTGKLLVSAPGVRLRVDGGVGFSGQDGLTIATNANIKLYLNCPSANLGGNGIINPSGTPAQCYIFGTTVLTSLALSGNGDTTAAIYVPYADVQLNGGGSSMTDLSGAVVANSFKFNGHYRVHYDEALATGPAWRGFTITSWNER